MNKPSGISEALTKTYSYRLAIKCTIIIAVSAILTALLLYFSLPREAGYSYAESFNLMSRLRGELLYKSAVIYIITALFQIIGIAALSLLYSHRIAGPLYRIGMFARKIASGNLSEDVRLRKHDAIHPIADDLNSIISTYREMLNQIGTRVKEIKKSASQADENLLRNKAAVISEKTDEIKGILSKIRL